MNQITATGTKGLLQWMQKYQPYLYRDIKGKIPGVPLSGIGIVAAESATTTANKSWFDKIRDLTLGAAQVYLTREQLKAQQKILDAQIARAQAGEPPLEIDPTQYGLPAPGVNVGLSADTKKFLMLGTGAAIAMWILSRVL